MDKIQHVLGISGGKDSAALAVYMQEKYSHIDMRYFFTDTGKELTETYDFLNRLEIYLGKPIERLNCGKDFDYFLRQHNNYLPSPQARWCTLKMKIEPFEAWVRQFVESGYRVHSYIAIRADEDREGYRGKDNIIPCFPFAEDGIGKSDVLNILRDAGLGLPGYYRWRSRSGCFFCFFQQRIEWVRLKEEHPDLFEQAKAYEKAGYKWSQIESLEDLEDPARVLAIKADYAKRVQRFKDKMSKIKNPLKPDVPIDDEDLYGFSKSCLVCHK